MVNILHIIQGLSLGGACRSMVATSKYSSRFGNFKHRVISLLPAQPDAIELAKEGGMLIICAPDKHTLFKEIENADIVHVNWWNNPDIYELLRTELPPIRLMIWYHVAGNGPPQIITPQLVNFADMNIPCNPFTYNELPVFMDMPLEKKQHSVEMVYDAADFERLKGITLRPHNHFNVGYIGTVDFVKMHKNYIRMSASVDVPGVKFIVCGGGIQEQLRNQAIDLGVEARFDFRGYVNDIKPVLEILDIYGYPLCEDTYAAAELNLQEIMYAGIPPVVFPYGGIKQLVKNEETGLIICSEAEYKEAIEYLFHHPEERIRLGRNAMEYAKQIFGAENAGKKLNCVYETMMRHPKKKRNWNRNGDLISQHQVIHVNNLNEKQKYISGAENFIETLGSNAQDYITSMRSQNIHELFKADKNIATSSPLLSGTGAGGILNYKNYYKNDGFLRLWSGLILQQKGNHAEAVAEFALSINLGCNHWRVFWYLAISAEKLGNYSITRKALQTITPREEAKCYISNLLTAGEYTDSPDLFNLLAELKYQEGKNSEAREIIRCILRQWPNNKNALNNLAIIEIHDKNWESAAEILKRSLEMDAADETTLKNLKYIENQLILHKSVSAAESLIGQGKYNEAYEILEKVLEIDKDSVDALNAIVKIRIAGNDFEAAEKVLTRVLQIHPANKTAVENLEYVKKRLNVKERPPLSEVNTACKASEVSPEVCSGIAGKADTDVQRPLEALNLQAKQALQEGNLKKARELLTKVLSQSPNNIKALNNLAVTEIFEENWKSAQDILQKVLQLDPSNKAALENSKSLKIHNESQEYQKTDTVLDKRCLPRISIVTPSFNQARYIEQTIQSVQNQGYPDYEHIIIDGGSTDGTQEKLKKYSHIKWISESDKGQSDALNKGFRMATGDITAWINSDDWYEPNVFRVVAEFFMNNPEKNVVMGDCHLVDEKGRIFDKVINYERGFDVLINYHVGRSIPTQPAIFFRKKLLDKYGYLDETLHYVMDYDLWLRFVPENHFYHINQTFANYRFHAAAKGGDQDWSKFEPECKLVAARYTSKKTVTPMVSVIIPCYNQAQFLAEAVESVVNQTFTNWECIIVNDGSPDNTSDIARQIIANYPDKQIRLIEKKNGGVSDARNVGIKNAKGNYILPLDADDFIHPEMLQKTVSLLKMHPEIAIAYSDVKHFGGANRIVCAGEYDFKRLCLQNHLNYCALFRREIWESVGGYNPNMVVGYEDWDFWVSCGEKGYYGKRISEPLFMYRIKETSRDTKAREQHNELAAQIVINHPSLYDKKYILEAKNILNNCSQDKLVSNHIASECIHQNSSFSSNSYYKILLVVHNFPPNWYAGVEIYTLDFAKTLIKKGCDVSVLYPQFVPTINSPKLLEDSYNGIKIFKLLVKQTNNLGLYVENKEIEDIFKNLLHKVRFEIIHFQHTHKFLPFSLVNIAKETGISVCLTLHDFWLMCPKTHLYIPETHELCDGPESVDKCIKCWLINAPTKLVPATKASLYYFMSYRQEYAKELLKNIDIVSAPSKYLANKFNKHGFGTDRIIISPLGLNPLLKNARVKSDNLVFGCIGTFHKLKNVVFLAKTFKQVEGKAELFFWGAGEPQTIEILNEEIKGDNRLRYFGEYSQTELPQILSNIDVMIVPSIIENYPLVARESLSAGIPVLASNVGGIPEIVTHMKNGILFNPSNKEELKERIQELIDDPTIIDKLKSGISPMKTMEEDVDEWINVYKSLLNNKIDNRGSSLVTNPFRITTLPSSNNVSNTKVSIIIPVFNKIEFTRKCLNSIVKNTPKKSFEVIIIDNASTDDTRDFLKCLEGDVKIITNDKNLGFGKACNQGSQKASTDYLLFLNNDTEPKEGWLEPLLEVLMRDNSVAAVGSKLLFPNETIQHAGVVIAYNKNVNDPLLATHIYPNEPANLPEANQLRTYQALTAACLLIRTSAFNEVGGFDEGYWNGYEDIDLCFKLQEKGWKIVYQPESVVIHYESKSGPERFSKVSENIQRLHDKWLGKITPDIIIKENCSTITTENNKIQRYSMPTGSMAEISNIKPHKLASIIILTWNAMEYTQKCIRSIQDHTHYPHEVIFVDNASTDGTVEYLRSLIKEHSNYKLIENKENRGFAAGNNQGVAAASGDYVLLLNNDVLVSDGWLESLVESLEKDEKIGMVGPITNSISGRQMVNSIPYTDEGGFHAFSQKIRKACYGRLTPRYRIAGFALLMKKSLYEDVGGLDESFGTGNYEDDDLCLKIRDKGYAVMVDESVFIHHYRSQTFIDNKIDYQSSLSLNESRFRKKWPTVDYEGMLELHGSLVDANAALVVQGQQAYDAGNINQSLELYMKVLNTNPVDEAALCGAGQVYQAMSEVDKAICVYEKVVRLSLHIHRRPPMDTGLHLLNAYSNLALLYAHSKQIEKAISTLKSAIVLNGADVSLYNNLGVLYFKKSACHDARDCFEKALSIDANYKEAQQNLEKVKNNNNVPKPSENYLSIEQAHKHKNPLQHKGDREYKGMKNL